MVFSLEEAIWKIVETVLGSGVIYKLKNYIKDEKDEKSLEETLVNNGLIIINQGGNSYVADQNPEQINKLVEQMREHPEDIDFEMYEQKFAREALEYKSEYNKGPEKFRDFLKHLKADYQSILNLAIKVDRCYENDEHKKAKSLKRDIRNMYGKDGVLLCNLYTSGYIPEAADYFSELSSEEMKEMEKNNLANGIIEEVLDSATSIYFVNEGNSAEELARMIRENINNNKKYIAVHSAGKRNVNTSKETLDKIQSIATDNDYNLESGRPETSSSAPHLRIILSKQNRT